MNYRKVYMAIINKAKSKNRKRIKGIHAEHHILPQSLFPLWSGFKKQYKWTRVLLTHREHFFCHQLALKIWSCNEMINTIWLMCHDKNTKHLLCKNSREYAKLQLLKSNLTSEQMKGNTYGTKLKGISKPSPCKGKTYEEIYGEDLAKEKRLKKTGKNNPMYGKNVYAKTPEKRDERRKKQSLIMTGRKQSDEHRKNSSIQKLGEKNPAYGKHWFNNGIETIFVKECPPGFIKGRLKYGE